MWTNTKIQSTDMRQCPHKVPFTIQKGKQLSIVYEFPYLSLYIHIISFIDENLQQHLQFVIISLVMITFRNYFQ